MVLTVAKQSSESAEETVAKLSDDIGKMADRIGDMADRIGEMSERILETQRIQSENLDVTQDTFLKVMEIMAEQARASNAIVEVLLQKEGNKG